MWFRQLAVWAGAQLAFSVLIHVFAARCSRTGQQLGGVHAPLGVFSGWHSQLAGVMGVTVNPTGSWRLIFKVTISRFPETTRRSKPRRQSNFWVFTSHVCQSPIGQHKSRDKAHILMGSFRATDRSGYYHSAVPLSPFFGDFQQKHFLVKHLQFKHLRYKLFFLSFF